MEEQFNMDKALFAKIYDQYLAMRIFYRTTGDTVLIKTSSLYVKNIMKQLKIEPNKTVVA
jgi:hypothetical protein